MRKMKMVCIVTGSIHFYLSYFGMLVIEVNLFYSEKEIVLNVLIFVINLLFFEKNI